MTRPTRLSGITSTAVAEECHQGNTAAGEWLGSDGCILSRGPHSHVALLRFTGPWEESHCLSPTCFLQYYNPTESLNIRFYREKLKGLKKP